MPFVLQSESNNALYFNGSTLKDKGAIWALFSPVENARQFEESEDALLVAATFSTPVNVVEI